MTKLLVIMGLAGLLAVAWLFWPAKRLSADELLARYATPLPAPRARPASSRRSPPATTRSPTEAVLSRELH